MTRLEPFGKRPKELAGGKGPQRAGRAGASKSISRIDTNRSPGNPGIKNVAKLATALGPSTAELCKGVDAAGRELSWDGVVRVGADKMNRKKGYNYLTVFADLRAKRVLLAVEGKDATVWERFVEELGHALHGPSPVIMPASFLACG